MGGSGVLKCDGKKVYSKRKKKIRAGLEYKANIFTGFFRNRLAEGNLVEQFAAPHGHNVAYRMLNHMAALDNPYDPICALWGRYLNISSLQLPTECLGLFTSFTIMVPHCNAIQKGDGGKCCCKAIRISGRLLFFLFLEIFYSGICITRVSVMAVS